MKWKTIGGLVFKDYQKVIYKDYKSFIDVSLTIDHRTIRKLEAKIHFRDKIKPQIWNNAFLWDATLANVSHHLT